MVLVADEVGKASSWSANAGVVTVCDTDRSMLFTKREPVRGIFYVIGRHNQPSRAL
jgi:hypothetical protein